MKFTDVKFALFVLIAGLLTACGAQPAQSTEPALPPTEVVLPTTAPPTDAPASTDSASPTEPAVATDPAAATQPPVSAATVSFANDVLPILQSRCVNCHGGNEIEEGLLLRSHPEVMAGSDNGPVVTPGDAANSLLVELVATMEMPKRGPKLTPPQIQIITDWVNQGALDN
ncbi:MAG TPA: c-type cytochrome domain-containing protein [Anaerolineales bacterium]|nr:c-type cytochrome domain-containing protein [Anaerolineales bacterium]